jgi:hypothetical protein
MLIKRQEQCLSKDDKSQQNISNKKKGTLMDAFTVLLFLNIVFLYFSVQSPFGNAQFMCSILAFSFMFL